jgi:hypothetical protein
MKSTLWWLGISFSTLSVALLIEKGIADWSFAVPLTVLLEWYENVALVLKTVLDSTWTIIAPFIWAWLGPGVFMHEDAHHILIVASVLGGSLFRSLPVDGPYSTTWRVAAVCLLSYLLACSVLAGRDLIAFRTPAGLLLALYPIFVLAATIVVLGEVLDRNVRPIPQWRSTTFRAAKEFVAVPFAVLLFLSTNAGLKLAGL